MKNLLNGVVKRFFGFFLTGVFAVLPLVITVAVVVWVAELLKQYVGPATIFGKSLEGLGQNYSTNGFLAYALGWVVVLGFLLTLGLLIELGAKRLLRDWIDVVLEKIPLVGSVYGTIRQLVNMMDKKGETDLQGMSVVFCIFGSENGSGVLALMPSPETFTVQGRDYHIVVIPTAPVPFGGGLLFMPKENVHPADMTVDGLMSIYVSMGVTTGQFMKATGGASSKKAKR